MRQRGDEVTETEEYGADAAGDFWAIPAQEFVDEQHGKGKNADNQSKNYLSLGGTITEFSLQRGDEDAPGINGAGAKHDNDRGKDYCRIAASGNYRVPITELVYQDSASRLNL